MQQRELLANTLQQQYQGQSQHEAVQSNIEALRQPNTFTVTTGHQLALFTGPLYFIYKIVSTIKLAEQLKQQHPQHNFVPVFWMASEDHDFAEIAQAHFTDRSYKWQGEFKDAVGRLSLKSLQPLLKELKLPELFERAYSKSSHLAEATRTLVHELFASYGLLVLDADTPELKQQLLPIIKADVLEQQTLPLVEKADAALQKLGYKVQAHARNINFFYLHKGLRQRIEQIGENFLLVDTEEQLSRQQLAERIEQYPERFSPNVILRPLYQELLLPNIAYLGGPAEVAYWLQLAEVFTHYKVPMPIVLPRNFVLLLGQVPQQRYEKLGLQPEQLFWPLDKLQKWYTEHAAKAELSLAAPELQLKQAMQAAQATAAAIDPTLGPMAAAAHQRMQRQLQQLQQRMRKARQSQLADAMRQLEAACTKVYFRQVTFKSAG